MDFGLTHPRLLVGYYFWQASLIVFAIVSTIASSFGFILKRQTSVHPSTRSIFAMLGGFLVFLIIGTIVFVGVDTLGHEHWVEKRDKEKKEQQEAENKRRAIQQNPVLEPSQHNLREMGMAFRHYNDEHKQLPPAGIGKGPDGKPLLSWRVALLRDMFDGRQVYNKFKLDEPWDSPNNIKLLKEMPDVYKLPGAKTPPGETVYQVFVGKGTAFDPNQPMKLAEDFLDNTINTILVVEAARSVPWSKPEDIPFDPNKPIKPLLGNHYPSQKGCLVLLSSIFDHFVQPTVSEDTLKVAIKQNATDLFKRPDW